MTDLDPSTERVLITLRSLTRDVGDFATRLLTGESTTAEEIRFAHRLVDCAEVIRDRVTGSTVRIVEGSSDASAPPDRPGLPGSARRG